MIRKALWLEYFTVGYNILEGLVSILAGLATGSIALVGFGSDSFIESFSGGIMIWRLRKSGGREEKKAETRAIRAIAVSFFLLAAYVIFEAVKKLYCQEIPQPSVWGIGIACFSIAIMIPIFIWKRRIGRQKNIKSLLIDAKQGLACMCLSATMLIGVGLNYLCNWWWADPVAAIIIAGFLTKEGCEALKEPQ
jgi:divalent metal cation (Fe/Co/Zn/Cd) transporter